LENDLSAFATENDEMRKIRNAMDKFEKILLNNLQ
jgi:hypothetical protein